MSDNGDYVERTTAGPEPVRREEVRIVRGSNNSGWLVAVLVLAIFAVGAFFLMNRNNADDVQAARDQATLQAQADNAAAAAQNAAGAAQQSAQAAISSTARATDSAATAASAADSARDASATAPAQEPPAPPPQ